MNIIIDIEDSVPIFAQLVHQIKQGVTEKRLAAGDALPSIRQLANDLELNNKTVAKAYKLLERDSIIQTKGYRGTFIHPEAIKHCTQDLNEWMKTQFTGVISEFKQTGLTDSEIRNAFTYVMQNSDKKA